MFFFFKKLPLKIPKDLRHLFSTHNNLLFISLTVFDCADENSQIGLKCNFFYKCIFDDVFLFVMFFVHDNSHNGGKTQKLTIVQQKPTYITGARPVHTATQLSTVSTVVKLVTG